MIVSGNTLQTLRLLNSAAKILRQPVSTLIAQSSVNVTVAIQICNSRFPRLSRHWGRRKNINCGQCQRNNRRRYLSHMSSQHAFERKSLPLYPHTVITLSSIAKCCWAMIRWNTSWHWVLLCQNWTLSQESKLDKKRADFWLKYYDTMDRTLLEQECADVFEKAFKDFPLSHCFSNVTRRSVFPSCCGMSYLRRFLMTRNASLSSSWHVSCTRLKLCQSTPSTSIRHISLRCMTQLRRQVHRLLLSVKWCSS